MTETIIKKFYVYGKDTHKHCYTIIFKKIMLDKPYYVRYNEKGDLVDLRKSQSYIDFNPSTDKLKQVKGYYETSILWVNSSEEEDYYDMIYGYDYYIKTPTKILLKNAMLLRIVRKIISSDVVFITRLAGRVFFDHKRGSIENEMSDSSDDHILKYTHTFITEDLLGEDIPTPDRAIKQIKARKDKERKKQSRCKLFETFILPGLLDIEGIHYHDYSKSFYIQSSDIVKLLKKHFEEVIIPKFKEAGAHIDLTDFNLGSLKYRCNIPLEKVKLDNIDDVE